jgi:hypothetical protein
MRSHPKTVESLQLINKGFDVAALLCKPLDREPERTARLRGQLPQNGIICASMNDRNMKNSFQDVIREAEALHVLEMDREAEALLRTLPEGSEDYAGARAILASTLLNSPGCAEVAEWGPDLVRKNPVSIADRIASSSAALMPSPFWPRPCGWFPLE